MPMRRFKTFLTIMPISPRLAVRSLKQKKQKASFQSLLDAKKLRLSSAKITPLHKVLPAANLPKFLEGRLKTGLKWVEQPVPFG
jgi:hypothetical protein